MHFRVEQCRINTRLCTHHLGISSSFTWVLAQLSFDKPLGAIDKFSCHLYSKLNLICSYINIFVKHKGLNSSLTAWPIWNLLCHI